MTKFELFKDAVIITDDEKRNLLAGSGESFSDTGDIGNSNSGDVGDSIHCDDGNSTRNDVGNSVSSDHGGSLRNDSSE